MILLIQSYKKLNFWIFLLEISYIAHSNTNTCMWTSALRHGSELIKFLPHSLCFIKILIDVLFSFFEIWDILIQSSYTNSISLISFQKSTTFSMYTTLSAICSFMELMNHECTKLLHLSHETKLRSSSLGTEIEPLTNLNLFLVALHSFHSSMVVGIPF